MDIRDSFKIGIIGHGFLGSSISHAFGLHARIWIYDKYKEGFNSLEETVENSDILFFCLHTPMCEGGRQDLSILDGSIDIVHKLAPENSNKIAVIKSTVLPGTNRTFQKKYPNLKFISNPEFLTARNNKLDFICASRHIFGGDDKHSILKMQELFEHRFGKSVPIYITDWESAELVKYTANCFFAVKVSYFNFIYDMCKSLGLNYDEIKDMVLSDGRIGRSHADVMSGAGVSETGKRGYGGHCFPKDINALIQFAKDIGLNPELIEASWSQNLKDRPEKDWEKLSGVIFKKNV